MEGAMASKSDLTGQVFGRLTIVGQCENIGKRTAWKCLCQCGNSTMTTTDRLVSGKTISCGCRKKETATENSKKFGLKPRHGMTNTPTWNTWSAMVYRCTNVENRQYETYGGMLCKEWKIFENFYSDMGERPTGTTLDRIDVLKGYFKDNCRWATAKTQQRNKTNTRYVSVNGKKMALMDLADKLNSKKSEAQYFFSFLLKLQKNDLEVSPWVG
jgi:hypothetical protein